MADKPTKTATDTATSDPDALQVQNAPLKEHGDKLEESRQDRRTENPAASQEPKRS